ncbi:MAG: VWA domain-containing protein, partial [Candidatus Hodarchaeota archaeon]
MSDQEKRDYWEAMKRYRRTFTQSISQRIQIQDRNYYWEAIKKHRRTVALLIAATITFPLFVFTALPPVEVVEEIPEEVVLPTETPITVLVNETVIVNTTIQVNTSEGGSFYIEPQPAPPLIDTDIVFCIDTSGSMDINRMPLAKKAINKTLELINQSYWSNLSNDRIGLVSFDANAGDWTTDATIHAGLDFISNQTHLELIFNEVNSFIGSGNTDAWAGLNSSLDLMINNQRDTPVLKTIIFLTDGKHNTGPWGTDVNNGNYTGFMQLPSNEVPYSESPIVVARENNVKIYSIGLFEGTSYDFDENFLRNISLDLNYGTFGDFFVGNNTLSITESFLKARDSASGWTPVIINETTVIGAGSEELFSFNVTKNVRRLKWDMNWENKLINFNLSLIHPNGSIISITNNTIENIIPFIEQQPKTVYIDFPECGIWQFNISWVDISADESIVSRLSSYEPPIFVESVTQINESVLSKIKPFYYIAELGNGDIFESQSILFTVNVTNKNPLFTFHNITPTLLTDLTVFSDNVSYYWDPPIALQLETGKSTSFL